MTPATRKTLRILLFTLLFLVLAGGAAVFLFVRNFKKPEIVSSHHALSMSDEGLLTGNTTLVVRNPNNFEIRVDSLRFKMEVQGRTYMQGGKEHPITLRPNSIDTFVLPYKAAAKRMKEDLKNVKEAETEVTVEGDFSVWKLRKIHLRLPLSKEIDFMEAPVMSRAGTTITYDTAGKVAISTRVKVINPTALEIRADSISYALEIEGKKYMKGGKLKPIHLKAHDSTWITLPASYDAMGFARDFQGRDSTTQRFICNMVVSTPKLKNHRTSVSFSDRVPVLTQFKVKLEELRVDKLRLKETQVAARVRITNANPIAFGVKEITYKLQVEGKKWVEGTAPGKHSFPKNGDVTITFQTKLDAKAVGERLKEYVKGNKELRFRLETRMKLLTHIKQLGKVNMYAYEANKVRVSKLVKKAKELGE